MKYWTLFTLRMMARAGLSFALVAWVVGLCNPHKNVTTVGDAYIEMHLGKANIQLMYFRNHVCMYLRKEGPDATETANLTVTSTNSAIDLDRVIVVDTGDLAEGAITTDLGTWIPAMPYEPNLDWTSVTVWASGLKHGALNIRHWLLCLTFLIATVATWPRKKPATKAENGTSTDECRSV